MSDLIEVCEINELSDGTMKLVSIKETDILLARVGEEYFAVDNRCPHMGGKLSQGILEGTIVTCPKHGSQFNLRDGQVARWLKGSGLISKLGKIIKSPRSIATYNVEVKDNKIWVKI